MEFFKNLDLTSFRTFKIAGLIIVGLILVLFAVQIVGSTFKTFTNEVGPTLGITVPGYGKGGGVAYDYDGAYAESGSDASMPQLSARNVGSMPYPYPQPPSGNTAELFEITQYSASIETRRVEETCDTVADLKSREDVIFESSNTYDRGCDFTFKAEKASADDVLAIIKDLDPKEISDNTYTIKGQIDDFTSETEVLTKKRASIDQTLASAISAYDEITALATRSQNADALAKIIDSKIGIIERLTQERININEQLDRLARAKADQLDSLDYTRFSVSVYENKFVDGEELGNSWKEAIKNFIRDLNRIIQDLTINLLLVIILVLQWAVYAFIVLIVAKYGWKLAKYIWYR